MVPLPFLRSRDALATRDGCGFEGQRRVVLPVPGGRRILLIRRGLSTALRLRRDPRRPSGAAPPTCPQPHARLWTAIQVPKKKLRTG